ncbi:MAG: hypothetical protein EPN21_08900 [Methylococcaceae bacterium]|nr:MAG: hypothetical protein EPN21_08900 [Methylococcaceae bacterium]
MSSSLSDSASRRLSKISTNADASSQPARLGLGLSGGGLRASFYHIGVLAQMAEQGLLRHVEVISTVSGGSIIGALYYLHVKKLLESKPDQEIADQDYVAIVQQIEKNFLLATEKNIRMTTFASFVANCKMFFSITPAATASPSCITIGCTRTSSRNWAIR